MIESANQVSSSKDFQVVDHEIASAPSQVTGVESNTDLTATTTNTLSAFSVVTKLQDRFSSLVISVQDRKSHTSFKYFLYMLMFNLYVMWCSIFIPTLGNFTNFGEYGSQVFTVATYPVTLSLQLLSYDASIALMSLVAVIVLLHLLMTFIAHRSVAQSSRHTKIVLSVSHFMNHVMVLGSLIFAFVLTAFVDCQFQQVTLLTDDDSQADLSKVVRYPTVECYSSPNIISYAISCSVFVLLLVSVTLSNLIIRNGNPLNRSLFISETSFHVVLLALFNCIEIFATFLIPNLYLYGRAILHLGFSVIWFLYVFFSVPYFGKRENALYSGTGLAKVGASIGCLVACFVNKSNEMGLAMMGLTLGLMLCFFLIGYISMEVVILAICKQISSIISNNPSPQQAFQCMDGKKRSLNIFLRLCVHISPFSKRESNYEKTEYQEMALSMARVITSNKNNDAENASLLLTSSLLIAYTFEDSNSYSYALYLLRRCLKSSRNFLIKFSVNERTKEVETAQNKDSKSAQCLTEIKQTLEALTKGEEELKNLHRQFWKELLNEHPNLDKLDKINRRTSQLSISIEETYVNLMSVHSKEKQVLRKYANFVETFRFDKELSQHLYQEAANIEEEESSKKAMHGVDHHGGVANSLGKFSNFDKTKRYSAAMSPVKFHNNALNMTGDLSMTGDLHALDDTTFNGIESKEFSKKELLIRNSLKTIDQKKALFVVFLIFLCQGSMTPLALLREISMIQNANQFMNEGYSISSTDAPILNFIRLEHKNTVNFYTNQIDDILTEAQSNTFTKNLYAIASAPTTPVLIPSMLQNNSANFDKNGNTTYIYSYVKNSSLIETLNYLKSAGRDFEAWKDMDYNQTIQNYQFMFVWRNHQVIRDLMMSFCNSALESSNASLSTFFQVFAIIFGSMAFCLSVSFFIYLLLMRGLLDGTDQVAKLFMHSLSKNVIGKIYHDLANKTDDDGKVHLPSSALTKPKNLFFILGMIGIVFCVLACGLMVMETNSNLSLSNITMLNVVHGTGLLRFINRANLRINSYFKFLSLNKNTLNDPSMASSDEIQSYNEELKLRISQIFSEWNYLIYGGGETDPSVGRYQAIDDLVQGVKNCSQLFQTNSHNMTDYDAFKLKYCTGLEDLIAFYARSTLELNDNFMSPQFLAKKGDAFHSVLNLYYATNLLCQKTYDFMTLFVKYSSNTSKIITILFVALGTVFLGGLFYYMFKLIEKNKLDFFHMKMMLNYLPLEFIDNNEAIKQFVLYNQIAQQHTNTIMKVSSKIMKKNNQVHATNAVSGDNGKVFSVLNSSVDGAIMCGEDGSIEFINNAALKMFGCGNRADVVGMPMYILFDSNQKAIIETSIEQLKQMAYKNQSSETCGEILEVDCLRRNSTKFHAKLNVFVVVFEKGSPVITCFIKDITSEKKQNALLAEEKAKSEHLLRNILPESVAVKLKSGETFIAEKFNDVTCFFSDMVGFTKMSSNMNANQLVGMLNHIVNGFDKLTEQYQLEKIKTIGDAYFCVGGLPPHDTSDHPERVVRFAIDTFLVLREYNMENVDPTLKSKLELELILVQSLQGLLEQRSINVASRMESTGIPGRIQISRSTYERVHDLGWTFEERKVEVKGKGLCQTYLLNADHHQRAVIKATENL
ncbi:hypothetical protein C9374_007392 [Naegleria lovaniensis]|uniref:Guanylate cyclase domain-containing protein n=1 Tax=Naegleria lovaniensis TaxID=51637 RepID=A0AA88GMZ4_NAELO|nr:uncharacterized protein C9374_007392 [Naegleria lovaniensis]KAG2379253.1 hypothetical protein C9374_007392 [Naegleria lovaniensis]